MASLLKYSKEGKDIIEKFNNLMPWEKAEMIITLYDSIETDEVESYFAEYMGYVKEDTIDPVQEVIDRNLTDEVLDEMDDSEIIEYLISSYYGNAAGNLEDMVEKMHWDDVSEGLSNVGMSYMEDILNSLYTNHKERFDEILNYMKNLKKNGTA